MRLGARTWREVERAAEPAAAGRGLVVAVPLGSCEQHGPHLPLDTDTRIAVALADRLTDARPDVVAAPAFAYGASGEHAGFPGTLSLGTEALALALTELVRSADAFAGVVFVNGHGGNADAVSVMSRRAQTEGRRVLAWWPQAAGDAHAGRTETSALLALAPAVVRVDEAEPGASAPIDELMPALRERGTRAVAANGVLGDPTGAGAEEGRALLDAFAADLVASVDRWRSAW